jgi:hypothetical protein
MHSHTFVMKSARPSIPRIGEVTTADVAKRAIFAYPLGPLPIVERFGGPVCPVVMDDSTLLERIKEWSAAGHRVDCIVFNFDRAGQQFYDLDRFKANVEAGNNPWDRPDAYPQ